MARTACRAEEGGVMKNASFAAAAALAVAAAMVLGCFAASAYAIPITPGLLAMNHADSANTPSFFFGNDPYTVMTSPMIGAYPQIALGPFWGWYNQDVSERNPTFETDSHTGPVSLDYLAYSFDGSAPTSITTLLPHTFSAQGMYTFDATGTYSAVSYEASDTIGIDRTDPVTNSNLVPVYDDSAVITLAATDTLSGPSWTDWRLDGASTCATECATGIPSVIVLSHQVVVSTPGWHTLRWFSIDNAGNFENTHLASFLVNPGGYTPILGRPSVAVRRRHTAIFAGSVTPATTSKTVTLNVWRKSGKSFKRFATYSVQAPKYASAYALAKYIAKGGTYRVYGAEGAGTSVWSKNFTIK